jgi:hypothetical protein
MHKYLSEQYGLTFENDLTSENGQLFLSEHLLLDPNILYFNVWLKQLDSSYVKEGLYNRNPKLTERTMSHDNLSGIFSISYVYGTDHRFSIWNYLLKHFGTYDNTLGKSKQFSRFLPFNISNFFIWGKCAESKIYMLFLPFYIINLILTCNKPKEDTSSKLLYWIELLPHKNHFICKHLYKYFEKKMICQYGIQYISALQHIYFKGLDETYI